MNWTMIVWICSAITLSCASDDGVDGSRGTPSTGGSSGSNDGGSSGTSTSGGSAGSPSGGWAGASGSGATGGSGSGGSAGATTGGAAGANGTLAESACFQCAASECSAEITACGTNLDCSTWLECVKACPESAKDPLLPEYSCEIQCPQPSFPNEVLVALGDCILMHAEAQPCATACGN